MKMIKVNMNMSQLSNWEDTKTTLLEVLKPFESLLFFIKFDLDLFVIHHLFTTFHVIVCIGLHLIGFIFVIFNIVNIARAILESILELAFDCFVQVDRENVIAANRFGFTIVDLCPSLGSRCSLGRVCLTLGCWIG